MVLAARKLHCSNYIALYLKRLVKFVSFRLKKFQLKLMMMMQGFHQWLLRRSQDPTSGRWGQVAQISFETVTEAIPSPLCYP